MPHPPTETNPDAWSRFFAIETNNRAWQLAAQKSRSHPESREMLDAAHTSVYHWNRVGTEWNRVRAKYLLAEVHALCGFGESALALANEVLSEFQTADAPVWERAYVHTIHAHAAATAGDGQSHAKSYANAEAALREIADPEERSIVEQTFDQVPKPSS